MAHAREHPNCFRVAMTLIIISGLVIVIGGVVRLIIDRSVDGGGLIIIAMGSVPVLIGILVWLKRFRQIKLQKQQSNVARSTNSENTTDEAPETQQVSSPPRYGVSLFDLMPYSHVLDINPTERATINSSERSNEETGLTNIGSPTNEAQQVSSLPRYGGSLFERTPYSHILDINPANINSSDEDTGLTSIESPGHEAQQGSSPPRYEALFLEPPPYSHVLDINPTERATINPSARSTEDTSLTSIGSQDHEAQNVSSPPRYEASFLEPPPYSHVLDINPTERATINSSERTNEETGLTNIEHPDHEAQQVSAPSPFGAPSTIR